MGHETPTSHKNVVLAAYEEALIDRLPPSDKASLVDRAINLGATSLDFARIEIRLTTPDKRQELLEDLRAASADNEMTAEDFEALQKEFNLKG